MAYNYSKDKYIKETYVPSKESYAYKLSKEPEKPSRKTNPIPSTYEYKYIHQIGLQNDRNTTGNTTDKLASKP